MQSGTLPSPGFPADYSLLDRTLTLTREERLPRPTQALRRARIGLLPVSPRSSLRPSYDRRRQKDHMRNNKKTVIHVTERGGNRRPRTDRGASRGAQLRPGPVWSGTDSGCGHLFHRTSGQGVESSGSAAARCSKNAMRSSRAAASAAALGGNGVAPSLRNPPRAAAIDRQAVSAAPVLRRRVPGRTTVSRLVLAIAAIS
jgi:hypothetical protein